MIENTYLRSRARYQLGSSIWSNDWLLMLAICAVWSIVSGIISGSTTTEVTPEMIEQGVTVQFNPFELVGTIITYLIEGVFMYGICRAATKLARGQKIEFMDTFAGFKENFSGAMILGLLKNIFIMLWTLLLIVPGIVKSYSYAMAYYLRQDDTSKEKQAIDYINQSKEMMDGYKWKLFCLDLSFIGWYIVGALCLGIGVFFVVPYHEVARANFYEELKLSSGMVNPPEGM